jgi:hypothetical protein
MSSNSLYSEVISVKAEKRPLPVADETDTLKGWYVEHFKAKREVWLTSKNGHTHIINMTTYEFNGLPKYLRQRIIKHRFLTEWREYQKIETIKRLTNAIELYRKYTENKQPIPVKPQFTCEILPFFMF